MWGEVLDVTRGEIELSDYHQHYKATRQHQQYAHNIKISQYLIATSTIRTARQHQQYALHPHHNINTTIHTCLLIAKKNLCAHKLRMFAMDEGFLAPLGALAGLDF